MKHIKKMTSSESGKIGGQTIFNKIGKKGMKALSKKALEARWGKKK